MIRYGLIGAGMMGQEHIRNIQLIDGVHVHALAEPNAAMRTTATKLAGSPLVFSDYKKLLAADCCDAYIIASPNHMHKDHLLDVLMLKKPILCEKPLAITSEQCRQIIAAAGETPVWVAMEYRYMPPVQQLIAHIRQGVAGTVRMVAIREHRYPFLQKVGDWNRFTAQTGGTLVEKCCHFWDLMRLLAESDPVRVYATASQDVNHLQEEYNGRRADMIDNAFVVLDFKNSTRAMLDLCMFSEGSHWQEVISVTGDAARIEARIPGPMRFSAHGKERNAQLAIARRQTRQEQVHTVEVDKNILQAGDHHGSTFFQHQRFRDLVRDGNNPEVTLNDGLWSVRVGEVAALSVKSGEAIPINP